MRLHIASLVGNLVSPALSSAMMNRTGPWLVMCVGIACLLVAAVAFMFVPETLRQKQTQTKPIGLRAHLSLSISQLKDSFSILQSPLILLLITTLLTQPIFPATIQLLIQFISKRYAVKLMDTGYVQTTYGAAQVFQALVVLPFLSSLLRNTSTWPFFMENDQQRDLSLARWSIFILIPGLLILGAAPTLAVFILGLLVLALGSGYGSLIKALMSLYVDPEHRSRLFSLVGMVDVAGSVYSGPMLAGLFSLGMKIGTGWIGLPYYVLAIITAGAWVVLLFVKLPRNVQSSPVMSPNTSEYDGPQS